MARVIARKDGKRVRLYGRPGNDLTWRFPLIVEALARMRSRSIILDGEAVACDENRPLGLRPIRRTGIVSKRKDSRYRSGRTPDWLKCRNPASPAAKRDAEALRWHR
jgi:ATP-dependent DNA ligase